MKRSAKSRKWSFVCLIMSAALVAPGIQAAQEGPGEKENVLAIMMQMIKQMQLQIKTMQLEIKNLQEESMKNQDQKDEKKEEVNAKQKSTVLEYGKIYHIENKWNNWSGGFLDVRGAGCEGNKLCVSTAESFNRASGSGLWKIVSPKGKRGPVCNGDTFYLLNQYNGGRGGYLDVNGAGCEGNKLCVSTSNSFNRANGSGTWKMILNPIEHHGHSNNVEVEVGMTVQFVNQYNGGKGGYLDVRGVGCEDNKLCVSTSSNQNRANGSGSWRFYASTN